MDERPDELDEQHNRLNIRRPIRNYPFVQDDGKDDLIPDIPIEEIRERRERDER